LFKGYGGHPGAAGFSIEPERIPELRAALSRAIAARVESIPQPTLNIDAFVELPDLTLDLVANINRLAPFGRGNPALALAIRDLRIQSEATIGRTGEHRRLTVEDAHDRTQTVFWWHGSGWPLPRGRFDLAVAVQTSDYRGVEEIQVQWLDAREREPAAIEIDAGPAFELIDYRHEDKPEARLRELTDANDLQIWAEGSAPAGVATATRQQLVPGRRLVVWTQPPGPRELQRALERVGPEQVILFAVGPVAHDPGGRDAGAHELGLDEEEDFMQSLAGMVKYALRAKEGQVELEAAAARLAHRTSTVVAGLEYLAAQGTVRIVERGDERWQVAGGTGLRDGQAADLARATLGALLAETAAYRSYARDVPASALVQN
jgi:single-stranded-DNA-specific exonuclease